MTMTEDEPSAVNQRLLATFELARAGRRQDGPRTCAELRGDAEAAGLDPEQWIGGGLVFDD